MAFGNVCELDGDSDDDDSVVMMMMSVLLWCHPPPVAGVPDEPIPAGGPQLLGSLPHTVSCYIIVCWLPHIPATCLCISGIDLLRQVYYTEIEVADQTFCLTQSQFTDTGPTSPSADPITPGAWQGSHWSASF